MIQKKRKKNASIFQIFIKFDFVLFLVKLAPTVRLNAIIMRSGHEALYEFIEAPNYNYTNFNTNECYRPFK